MKLLITGGCGFLGSNLAHAALGEDNSVIIFDNLSRAGAIDNLNWLRNKGDFQFIHGDIRNYRDIVECIRLNQPDVIFHLAGQVAMTTSIINPLLDFEVNTVGTLNLLEAVRNNSAESIVIYSSTNKVYGDLQQYTYEERSTRYICIEKPNGFNESTPLNFHSPYGCSKGSADQYMLDYARIFGLRTIVFRHSSMFGSRQFATYDQGWIGWFCQKAVEKHKGLTHQPFTISGDGKQVRDVLYAEDMVDLYMNAIKYSDKAIGNAFNIGGGLENSLSVLELLDILQQELNETLEYNNLPFRISDQKVFIADIEKAKRVIKWEPKIKALDGILRMVRWEVENFINN